MNGLSGCLTGNLKMQPQTCYAYQNQNNKKKTTATQNTIKKRQDVNKQTLNAIVESCL